MKKIMLKHLFINALTSSLFILINLQANEIRLYQESDHKVLSAMLASNEELLVLGNDFTTRVSETARYTRPPQATSTPRPPRTPLHNLASFHLPIHR